jgi:toxin FitB
VPPPRHPVVVDTDITSLLWRDRLPDAVRTMLIGRTPFIAFVTVAEFWRGAYRAGWSRARIDEGVAWYEQFQRLHCTGDVVKQWGRLSGMASRDGHTVPTNDGWIAACCVVAGYPLLTGNRRHFEPLQRHGLELV